MFTGLIEEIGRVERLENGHGKSRLVVAAEQVSRELRVGDSVAVNGVCLTAVEVTPKTFAAELAEETLRRTSLAQIAKGAPVNLELPTKSGERLGGHVVQGHVDATGTVTSIARVNGKDDYWLSVAVPRALMKYIVEKGSIAIEGISLTVAKAEGREVSLAIIPHTYKATNLSSVKPGDTVNIEVDVLAKYAEKMAKSTPEKSSITLQRLIDEGF